MAKKNTKMQTYTNTNKEYEIREETLNGRVYTVVPVTMMVEGVHQGSHGPLLHTASELGKIPESWNGIPVTVGHPMIDGSFVSANSPQVLESWAIGHVFHTNMNDVRLKSEAWLEKTKLALNENLNDRITNGELIEVSVGVFSEDEAVEGTWHNETYAAIARNLRPDHLAILPNQTGACSVEDGCGIRVNEAVLINEDTEIKRTRRIINLKKEDEIMEDTKCAPCISIKATELINNNATQFTEKDRGWLETLEELQLDKMTPKEMTPEEKKKMADEMEAKMKTNAVITPEMAVNALKTVLKGEEDFINLMPKGMQEQTRSALRLFQDRKDSLIGEIITNTEAGTWTKEELGVYEVEKLEKIAKTAGVKKEAFQVNYSGMGAGADLHVNKSVNDVEPMAPAGITFETAK